MGRVGTRIRAVRIKKRLRQQDVAERAGVARSVVSKIERGQFGNVTLNAILAVAGALGIRVDLIVTYLGADLDRLVNSRHAGLHESVARAFLDLPDWVIVPEVSYAEYGERGVIDILAWHAATRTLLVIELKTAVIEVNELMGKVDQKRRLAVVVAKKRGWHPVTVAAWVIVADSKTNRRTVSRHRTTLRAAFSADGRTMRAWLRQPAGPVAALSFWSDAAGGSAKSDLAAVSRVRRPRPKAA